MGHEEVRDRSTHAWPVPGRGAARGARRRGPVWPAPAAAVDTDGPHRRRMRAYTHVTADFLGVDAARLREASLLTGLLIAAAGAAGFPGSGTPVVRHLPNDAIA